MTYHLLNGDAIAENFPEGHINGQPIIIREAFIEGPVTTEFSKSFWELRSAYVAQAYDVSADDYRVQFLSQLDVMNSITDHDDVCFWFEDDLFCLVNFLFSIYYLSDTTEATFYRVFPEPDTAKWRGFGSAGSDKLIELFENKVVMSQDEIMLARHLWEAMVTDDRLKLKALSFSDTTCFRSLPQVIQAHLDRNPDGGNIGRPYQTLIDILNTGETNFHSIYDEFWKRDAIYGFGDMQVYNMLKEMEIEFTGDIS